MEGLEIEIVCGSCGAKHNLALDASGHHNGRLPCDPSKRIELQIQPDEWREMVEAERAKVKH